MAMTIDEQDEEDLMNKPLDPRLVRFLEGSRLNSDRGANAQYAAAQARALSQLGTLGGRAPDTGSVTDYANAVAKGAAGDQAADQDVMDRDTKLKQYLLGLKQQRELKNEELGARQAAAKEANLAKIETAKTAAQARADALKQQQDFARMMAGQNQAFQASQREQDRALRRETVEEKIAKPKDPTADQFKAGGFARRVEQSLADMDDLKKEGYDRSSTKSAAAAALIPDALASNEYKRQEQAERNFINAVLRRESGAAISPGEFSSAEKQYFPRAGDTPDVLAQKMRNRQQTFETLKAEGGGAFERVPAVARPAPKTPKTEPGQAIAAPGGPAPGTIEDGHKFLGGDPSDPKNWEEVK